MMKYNPNPAAVQFDSMATPALSKEKYKKATRALIPSDLINVGSKRQDQLVLTLKFCTPRTGNNYHLKS